MVSPLVLAFSLDSFFSGSLLAYDLILFPPRKLYVYYPLRSFSVTFYNYQACIKVEQLGLNRS